MSIILSLLSVQIAGDDLSKLWKGLKLTENEEQVIILSDETVTESRTRGKQCLLALIIADKGVSKEVIDQQCHRCGNPKDGSLYRSRGNRFVTEFQKGSDKQYSLGRPS